MADYSLPTTSEDELQDSPMGNVTHIRVVSTSAEGSQNVPIDDFSLPSDQISYDPSISGMAATNAKEAIDELNAGVNLKENAANKKTVINDSDVEFPTSKAVKDGLSLKLYKANVYNGLDKNEAGFALDARQGKVLNDNIENLSGEIGSESSARTAGDNALQASINQEILDRQNEIQGLAQTVNSNTEEIHNEITNRTQTVNALRNELLNKSIGSIATGAEEKPAEGVSRRYRFTDDGNCYFTDVLNGLTFDVMPVPFQVSKDDELSVIIFDGDYTYIYFPTMTELKNSIGTAMGDISSALDEILIIGGGI